MRLVLPQAVEAVLARLWQHGYSAQVVGGCVRSLLLGQPVADWDICTSALPAQVTCCFSGETVVETGVAHGTVTLVRKEDSYEITTYRTEGTYTDHRRPDSVCFSALLAEDLARRDFTINAMAYSPREGITDLYGGQADLQNGVLCCVGSATQRFTEDALRILRALRFAAVLGFSLEATTQAALGQCAPLLSFVAPQRQFAELTKLLLGQSAGAILAQYGAVLATALPSLAPMLGFAQENPYHNKDVWQHTAAAVGAAVADPVVRWALLFHDAAKPACFTRDSMGCGHFYGHSKHSAVLAQEALLTLRAPTALREAVCHLVAWHDAPLEPTPRGAARRLRQMGEAAVRQLIEVQRGDICAQVPALQPPRLAGLAAFALCLEEALANGQAFTVKALPITGKDVLALGVPQGPEIGALLDAALTAVVEGTLPCERQRLLDFITTIRNLQHTNN